MAKDVNLTSQEWCDLVFEGKNQKYGAYYLRKTSSKRHFRALLIVVSVVAILVFLPALIERIIPEKEEDMSITDKVTMANIIKEEAPVEKPVEVEAPPPPKLQEAIKFTPPVIDKNATDEDEMLTQEDVNKSKAAIFTQTIAGSGDEDAIDPGSLDKVVTQVTAPVQTKTKPLDFAEQMPEFPGGDGEMRKFLNANLRYPQIAIENGISGRVVIRFAVSETGKIGSIEVYSPVDPSLNDEAVRLVKSMPNWIPGKQNGKNVAVYFILPVVFALDNN